jgi:hypothetical protein
MSLFVVSHLAAQHSITVLFLYGSKPAHGYKQTEHKLFGGIHGGHVSIRIDSNIFSFQPKYDWHIFPHHKKIVGGFILEDLSVWVKDTAGDKYTSIEIPVTDSQYVKLKQLEKDLLAHTPYDYAFFGVRCAAGAADVLEDIGILKPRSVFGDVMKYFYPQKLRRRLLKYANEHHFTIHRQPGKISRKWERE